MKLKVTNRDVTGTAESGRLRLEGLVPGVVFGGEAENKNISFVRRELQAIIAKEGLNALIELEYEDGTTDNTVIKQVDRNHLKGTVNNVTFYRVVKGQKLRVTVPIILEGADTVKEGIVEQQLTEVEVETIPSQLPREVVVSVEGKVIGDVLTVADLDFGNDQVEVITDPEQVVVIVAPETIPDLGESEAEAAEPEVIGETTAE